MTIPKRCGAPATHRFVPYGIAACAEHVATNTKKNLTYAPSDGVMVGAAKGSRYERRS